MPDVEVNIPSKLLPVPWMRRPAFFERATGLVFINTTSTQWKEFGRAAVENRHWPGSRSLLERLHHEFYHYLQFFGCGYMTQICARHYEEIKNASPFPFTQLSLDTFLSKPVKRPDGITVIARDLRRVGVSGLSPLHIVEGCAYLFQHLATNPHLLHGQYLVQLSQAVDSDLYGKLYHEATLVLGERALSETLFLGMCSLEYAEPQFAFDAILKLNAKLDSLRPSDVQMRRQHLIAEVSRRWEYLGTAYRLAASGDVYHPLLTQDWIFHDAPDWTAAVGAALAGHMDDAIADCIRHAPVVLENAIRIPDNYAQTTLAKLTDEVTAQFMLACISIRFGSSGMDEDLV